MAAQNLLLINWMKEIHGILVPENLTMIQTMKGTPIHSYGHVEVTKIISGNADRFASMFLCL